MSSIISAVLYQLYNTEADGSKIGATSLYAFVVTLVVVWAISFAVFLKLINPQYIRTFYSTETGVQATVNKVSNGDDLQKSDLFYIQKRLWSSIRGEVKEWTTANWSDWESNPPDWFTEHFVARVPDEFIPVKVDPNRGRSSFFWALAGGIAPAKATALKEKLWKRSTGKVAQAPKEESP
jgi:hypothetical protein